jgi:hypothetical protein
MSYHKALGAFFLGVFKTNQTIPRKAPMVILQSSQSHLRRVLSIFENYSLQAFHQTSSVQMIFTYVRRFDFQTLVLSLYHLFMTMHLLRFHTCNVVFHSLHYHLVIWGYLLLVLILSLTLIKSMTICPLPVIFLSHTFNFRNKIIGDHPMPYSSYSWPTLTTHTPANILEPRSN